MSNALPELRTAIYSRATFETFSKAQTLAQYLMSSNLYTPSHWGRNTPLQAIGKGTENKIIKSIAEEDIQEKRPQGVYSLTFFERRKKPECSYRVEWSTLPHVAFTTSSYDIEQEFVIQPNQLKTWLEFVFGLIDLHEAWYARIFLGTEHREKNYLSWQTQLPQTIVTAEYGVGLKLEEGVPGVYWGNYFGPFYVNWFGREKFETMPCIEKHWLKNGGVFFTTSASPFDWETREARQLEKEVKEHLGSNAFFDIETVRIFLAEAEPIPQTVSPEFLQPPRWVPNFPFIKELSHPQNKKKAVVIKKAYYST